MSVSEIRIYYVQEYVPAYIIVLIFDIKSDSSRLIKASNNSSLDLNNNKPLHRQLPFFEQYH